MQTTVSFPGLGIQEFVMERDAFSLFGRDVYWYGIFIMLGILAAFVHALWRAGQEGIKSDHLFDMILFVVPIGVVGARLWYVIFKGGYTSLAEIIAVWEGGLGIYGGIIAGGLALVGVCLFKKLNVLKVMDAVAPGVMVAQAMGRWGNFVNGEAFGSEVAASSPLYFLRMGVVSNQSYQIFGDSTMHYVHPTFLYEALWNILGFVLITSFYRKKKFNGQVVLSYLAWYGFGRMLIEGLRMDSLGGGNFRVSQIFGLICFVLGSAALIIGFFLAHNKKLPSACLVSLCPKGTKSIIETENITATPAEDENENENENETDPHTVPHSQD